MSYLFGRIAKLTIGVPGQTGRLIESFTKDQQTGVIVEGLRITFNIEKTFEPSPNKATIDVYNLAPQTRALLKKKGVKVTLEVGYGAILNKKAVTEVIFKGDAVKSKTVKRGADRITTVELADGLAAMQESTVNMSFAPGSSVKQVMGAVMGKFGLPQADVSGADGGGTYQNGVTISGMAKDVMNTLAGKTGSEWSVQDGSLQVLPINGFTKDPVIVLSPSSGLIGSPNLSGFQNSQEKKDAGIEFNALIIAGLKPGRRVKIESEEVNGQFIVRKVTFKGDTQQGPWFAECQAVQ